MAASSASSPFKKAYKRVLNKIKSDVPQSHSSPSAQDPQILELYLATTNRKTRPGHWLFMLRSANSARCNFYHMAGGLPPSTYYFDVLENKRFKHRWFPV
ncbi:hypothetical protein BDV19DRAFT_395039 [Aspergillus venezuelensis]